MREAKNLPQKSKPMDYSFYAETYMGTLLSEEEFPKYIDRAGYRLDELIFARHRREDLSASVQTRVNLALCAIADLLYSSDSAAENAPAASSGIAEERVGDHTVKYRDAISAEQAMAAQIRSVATAYLLPTGLLNRATLIVD